MVVRDGVRALPADHLLPALGPARPRAAREHFLAHTRMTTYKTLELLNRSLTILYASLAEIPVKLDTVKRSERVSLSCRGA